MLIRDIQTFLQPRLQQVEAIIRRSLESDVPLLDATNQRLREHPGKMMRPQLALLMAGAIGVTAPDTYRYAAAVELLHNATLLHDDVVDGATVRRGLPTVASLLGGGPAVLVGDFWLVKCIQQVLAAEDFSLRVLHLFSDTLGALTEGELLQMQKASLGDTSEEDYLRIIHGKTASLFALATRTAAISVHASPEMEEAAAEFGHELGIAFQIKDDIFDYQDPSEALGKPVGIDLKEQKITQPLLCALEKAPAPEAAHIRSLVTSASEKPGNVAVIQSFVKAYDGVAAAVAKLEEHLQQAIGSLEAFPASEEKTCLESLARYVANREA